jgi:putative DNA primase/helicase
MPGGSAIRFIPKRGKNSVMTFKDLMKTLDGLDRQAASIKARMTGGQESLNVTLVKDVQSEAVSWTWPGRLACGHVTLMAGAPGDGKSQISCDVTARITTGNNWPDGGRAPLGSVVMLSAEDSVKDVIRPRLEAAGADLKKIHVVNAALSKDGKERTFDLQTHLAELRRLVAKIGDVVLVILDPITSYMGNKIDSHRTTDVRSVLEPLSRFAEDTEIAVLAISHPPKAAHGKAINAVTGSLAFVAAARMVFMTATEPETKRRLLLPVKNNLGAPAPGLGYRMEQRTISRGIVGSRIRWDSAPVKITADEALRQSNADGGRKVADAKAMILEALSEGAMSAEALNDVAQREDISLATIRRARTELKRAGKIVKTKTDFKGGWEWSICEDDHAKMTTKMRNSKK